MNEYCLITFAGDKGTFEWFGDVFEARDTEYPEGTHQHLLEYKGGRERPLPVGTKFRNEWCRRDGRWRQIMDEDEE